MRLRLVESAQPINKLDYNIQNVVLPAVNSFGCRFAYPPNKLNSYKYYFKYFDKELDRNGYSLGLILNTSNILIDEWNNENSDLFVADLYMEIVIAGRTAKIGCIPSNDYNTIVQVIKDSDFSEVLTSLLRTPDKNGDEELIPPKRPTDAYKTMTAKEWKFLRNRLYDDFQAALEETNAEMTEEEQEAALKAFKNKGTPLPEVLRISEDYRNRYMDFLRNVYPLDMY